MTEKISCVGEGGGTKCDYFHFEGTGLDLVVCSIDSEGVYGNIIIETPMLDDGLPLSYGVERMIHGGSESFGKDFVWRLAREISGAFINSKISSDYTSYTMTAETDAGLIALLMPYLDAIFSTSFTQTRYNEVIVENASDADCSTEAEWLAKLYPSSSVYSKPPYPTLSNLARAISLQDLANYHRKFYTLRGTTIIIGGPVRVEEIRDVVDACQNELFSTMKQITDWEKIYPPLNDQAPQLRQPEIPAIPKARKGKKNNSGSSSTTAASSGAGGLLNGPNRALSAPLVRFRSVIEDPLNSAPKIPAMLVKGNLSSEPDVMYDVHLIFQGPDYQDPCKWLAFQLISQHLCRMFNELVELKQTVLDGGDMRTEGIMDVADSCAFSLNLRRRRHMLAVFTSCGVKHETFHDTMTMLPEFIKSLPDMSESVWSFQTDLIQSMIHQGWLMHTQEISLRAEYELVNSMTTWAKFVKPRCWQTASVSDCKLAELAFKYSAQTKKCFDFLRAQSTKFWLKQYRQFWVDQNPIIVIRPTSDLILYPSNLIASTSAIGSCFPNQELVREKEWDTLVDEEVDGYLQSIGA